MRALLVLILVAVSISTAEAHACWHSGYYASCGFWGWSRCYRARYTFCVHGGWSSWRQISLTACSKTCGEGMRTRTHTRSCINPPPSGHGAHKCGGRGWKSFPEICNVNPCYDWLNSTCEADTDCPAADSLCVEGKCLCVHSYYYSWSGDSCIPECSEEDRQRIFLLYPSMYNKAKPQNATMNTTLEECLETCRDRPDCHFINFNKSRGNCFSSESLMSNLQTNKSIDFYRATCA